MYTSWKGLTLEEAVARAKGITRQALHIAIKTYTANGNTAVVDQLREVRTILKRDHRIAKVGIERVLLDEAKKAAKMSKLDK